MESVAGALESMGALLLITALGFVAAKLGYLTDSMKGGISRLVFNITLPCMIVASAAKMDPSSGGDQITWALILGAAFFFVMLAAGAACVLVLRPPESERHLYVFMSTFTNTGFIGFAVVESIFGSGAVFLGSIFVALFNLFFYSIGVALLARGDKKAGGARGVLRNVINAPLLASVAAMALFASGTALPAALQQTAEMAGGVTSPLAMMLVGLALAGADLRGVFSEWRLYAFAAVRFLAVPAIAYLALENVVPSRTALCVFTVLLATPVASMAPTLAAQYGQDDVLPAKGTILTTLASFAFIPLLATLMAAV